MRTFVLITAAGVGKRAYSKLNKIFMLLQDVPVIVRTINCFDKSPEIDEIVIIAREEDHSMIKLLAGQYNFQKLSNIVTGGEERQHSVYRGLLSLTQAQDNDIVLIHNGVNPFVDQETIRQSIAAANDYGAAVVGYPVRETIKSALETGFVDQTLNRSKLWQIQTPQTAKYSILKQAFEKAFKDDFIGTDDSSLIERFGCQVKMIECPRENIKLTYPGDFQFADQLQGGTLVGLGMDSHWFEETPGKPLILGGVKFDGNGFKANSDGDVILHAIFNAISQALGENSLGHFADSMCAEGITDSKIYLKEILSIMYRRGYRLSNIGIMIEGKTPRISGQEERIKNSIAQTTDLPHRSIGITATSGEELTFFGQGKAVQCFAVVALCHE